jgi:polar amino acid transport system substrate-binding protein
MISINADVVRDVVRLLAPAGRLRVGLYLGSPLSLIEDPATGERNGVGFELGREFASRLGVAYEPVVYKQNGEVIGALKSGSVDILFTNATPARAKDIDFTQPYLEMDAGYLVAGGLPIATLDEVDRPGVRVVVVEGSTSVTKLPALLKNATVMRTPNLDSGVELLALGKADVFATNKTILFELAEKLPGSKVLDGRYGVEQIAMGMAQGKAAALEYACTFITSVIAEGLVEAAAKRARVRGAAVIAG